MRAFVIAVVMSLTALGAAAQPSSAVLGDAFSPRCSTGAPCGNACIRPTEVCHVLRRGQHCETGKRCLNVCIARRETCQGQIPIWRGQPACPNGKKPCGIRCIRVRAVCHVR